MMTVAGSRPWINITTVVTTKSRSASIGCNARLQHDLLQTVQYVQLAAVQYILDTVVQALAANPDRKFVYGEMVSLL